jgi:K+ transporter
MMCPCRKAKANIISILSLILILLILIFGVGYQLGSLKADKYYEKEFNHMLSEKKAKRGVLK